MKSLYQISPESQAVLDNAMFYLNGGPIQVIGHGHISRKFISEKLKMPPLPFLADNKEERDRLAASAAPWYKRLSNNFTNGLDGMANGIHNFLDYICDLYDAEMNKRFISHNDLAYIEDPLPVDPGEHEEVPEEKEVAA